METSIFIAQLAGPVIAAFGVTLFLNRGAFDEMIAAALHSKAMIIIAGAVTLLAGLAIVNTHNFWGTSWPVVITIFGWLAVVGGLARVLAPGQVQAIGAGVLKHQAVLYVAAVAWIIFGLFLSYQGYVA